MAPKGLWPFDCDTGSLLFIAVAERQGWPLHLVEVPGHNSVRWRRPDGSSLNWDVNEAESIPDEQYSSGTPSTGDQHRYKQDLTWDTVEAYYAGLYVSSIQDDECVSTDLVDLADLAELATEADPNKCDHWDTLTCAHAAAGHFDRAIAIETTHFDSTRRSDLYRQGRTCYEPEVVQAQQCAP